jgi:hypothetical protein
MIYRVYNHNHQLLGQFKTRDKAQKEAWYYMEQTGNAAYIMEDEQ